MGRKDEEKLPPKVRKRGKGYTYRYNAPVLNPDGTPGRKQKETQAYQTAAEAYNAGVVIEAKLIEGTYVDEKNVSFTEWAERGLEIYASANKVKSNTIDVRRANLKYAKLAFAGKKLKDITPHMYQTFLLDLRDKHDLGNSSIQGAHEAMKILFKLATKLKIISSNPTIDAIVPTLELTYEQLERFEDQDAALPEYLEKEQLALLLKTAKQYAAEQTDPYKAFGARQHFRAIYLLAHTGMRIGELCALEKKRWDTKKRTVRIIATLYYRMGVSAYKLEPPKTKSSIRTVDFSQSVAAILENQLHDLKVFRMLTGESFYNNKREFTLVNFKKYPGYPLDPDTFNDDLTETQKLAGLSTSITAHSLRHTFTSLSAEAGASLEDIQKQLGHSSDEVTKRVYLHVTEARRRANVDKLDNLLNNLLSDLN